MQSAQLPAIKEIRPEYAEINAQVLQDVLHRLDKTFAAFFRRVRAGETPGYPRFQGTDRYHSFTSPQVGAHGGAALDGEMVSLSKIGRIRMRLHRPLHGIPKTVTVSREADGWYAGISCAAVPLVPLPPTGHETGIDVGLKVFLINADGEVVENPRHYRKAEKQLAKANQRVSRRQQGSTRRHKAVALLRLKHQRVQRQRRDFHHKVARALLQQYDVLYVEDVQVRNMVRNRHLAKRISDAGWAAFRTILTSKAAYAGKWVVAVPARLHQPGLQRRVARWQPLCAAGGEKPLGAHSRLSGLWLGAGPRRKRGAEYSAGRAGPSGSGGVGCRGELRSPRLQPWGACHDDQRDEVAWAEQHEPSDWRVYAV